MTFSKTINSWNNLPVVLDLQTVAILLGVTDETIKKWVCRGEFEGTKIGRKWFFDREYVRGKIQKIAS